MADSRLIFEQYFDSSAVSLQIRDIASSCGTNNVTKAVDVINTTNGDHRTFILRVYQSHASREGMLFEHDVLNALQLCSDLRFQVPKLVRTKEGVTFALVAGQYVAMFEYIQGVHPDIQNLQQIESIGQATAELVRAMEHLHTENAPVFPRYDDMYHTHPALKGDRDRVLAFLDNLENNDITHHIPVFKKMLFTLEEALSEYGDLPQQIIHGDITMGNLLVLGTLLPSSANQIFNICSSMILLS